MAGATLSTVMKSWAGKPVRARSVSVAVTRTRYTPLSGGGHDKLRPPGLSRNVSAGAPATRTPSPLNENGSPVRPSGSTTAADIATGSPSFAVRSAPISRPITRTPPKSTPVTISPGLVNSTGRTPIGPSGVIVRPVVGCQPMRGMCTIRYDRSRPTAEAAPPNPSGSGPVCGWRSRTSVEPLLNVVVATAVVSVSVTTTIDLSPPEPGVVRGRRSPCRPTVTSPPRPVAFTCALISATRSRRARLPAAASGPRTRSAGEPALTVSDIRVTVRVTVRVWVVLLVGVSTIPPVALVAAGATIVAGGRGTVAVARKPSAPPTVVSLKILERTAPSGATLVPVTVGRGGPGGRRQPASRG